MACQKEEQQTIIPTPEEPTVEIPTPEPTPTHDFNHIYDIKDDNIASHVYLIHMDDLKNADEIMLAVSIQGIVAQEEASIYILTSGPSQAYWFDELELTYTILSDVWELVDLFKHHLTYDGYILYTPYTESMNVATTVSGLEKSVMITERLENEAISHGLVLRRDVRLRDTRWVISVFQNQINFKAIASQPINNLANRDFIISQKGLIITNLKKDLEGYEALIPKDTPMLGWGTDEVSDVFHLSQKGITTVASDHAWNVSFLSQVKRYDYKQVENNEPTFNPYKHYVSFIMTDGDNVQWLLGNDHFFNEKYYGNKNRGQVPVGWTIAPIMYTLAPSALQSYYKEATPNDELVGGPSGIGYINPDVYPKDALVMNANRTNNYYQTLDIDYMTIIGSQNQFLDHIDVLNVYANKQGIDGGFVFANFDRYKGYNGKLWWYNEKPFLSVREAMWDLNSLEPLADRINSFKVNPYRIDGYTLVIVHVWSHDYDDVVELASMFDDHVEIILPSQMMGFIEKHVPKIAAQPS